MTQKPHKKSVVRTFQQALRRWLLPAALVPLLLAGHRVATAAPRTPTTLPADDKQALLRKYSAEAMDYLRQISHAKIMASQAKTDAEQQKWKQTEAELQAKLLKVRKEARNLSAPPATTRPDRSAANSKDPWAWLEANREEVLKVHYPAPPADAGNGPWPTPKAAGGKSLAERMKAQKELQAIGNRMSDLMTGRAQQENPLEMSQLSRRKSDLQESLSPISLGELLSLVPPESRGEWKDFQTWDWITTRTGGKRQDPAIDRAITKWFEENAKYLIFECEGVLLRAHLGIDQRWLLKGVGTVVVDGVAVPYSFTVHVPSNEVFATGQRVRMRLECYFSRPYVSSGGDDVKGLNYSPDGKKRLITISGNALGKIETLAN